LTLSPGTDAGPIASASAAAGSPRCYFLMAAAAAAKDAEDRRLAPEAAPMRLE
jgi:hypothetical protein